MLKQQVEDDTLLWLRQVYLHHRASKAASPEKVVTALEQPDDPEAYLGESKKEAGGGPTSSLSDVLVVAGVAGQSRRCGTSLKCGSTKDRWDTPVESRQGWARTCRDSGSSKDSVDRGMVEKIIEETPSREDCEIKVLGSMGSWPEGSAGGGLREALERGDLS